MYGLWIIKLLKHLIFQDFNFNEFVVWIQCFVMVWWSTKFTIFSMIRIESFDLMTIIYSECSRKLVHVSFFFRLRLTNHRNKLKLINWVLKNKKKTKQWLRCFLKSWRLVFFILTFPLKCWYTEKCLCTCNNLFVNLHQREELTNSRRYVSWVTLNFIHEIVFTNAAMNLTWSFTSFAIVLFNS